MTPQETIEKVLAQADESEARDLFIKTMRSCVRIGLLEAMAHEVELLCGPRYHPDPDSEFKRAGSERGHIYTEQGKDILVLLGDNLTVPQRILKFRVSGISRGIQSNCSKEHSIHLHS